MPSFLVKTKSKVNELQSPSQQFRKAGAAADVGHLKLDALCRHAGPHPSRVGIETCRISPEVTNTISPR
jgi:hypothetical protein